MEVTHSDGHTSPDAEGLSGLRVLVVDDSWHVVAAIESLLRSFGAEVIGTAASSSEAEQVLAKRNPDVAIVDLSLRGGELAHGLIEALNDLAVPVVVLSGYSPMDVRPKNAFAVLQKPISEAELLAVLQGVRSQL
jgi:CheY-like chemotaxis protein